MNTINIITTAERSVLYIHDTMKSIFASKWEGQINLIAGSKDTNYLNEYKSNPQCKIIPWWVPWMQEGAKEENEGRKRARCGFNHIRAIAYGPSPCLIIEDDVIFVPGWQEELQKITNSMSEVDYVLDVGKHQKDTLIKWDGSLQGAWGLYFSSVNVRLKSVEYLLTRTDGCCDVLIGKSVTENFTLWQTKTLVRHIGNVSTFSRKDS
jgi:hypothetical protein